MATKPRPIGRLTRSVVEEIQAIRKRKRFSQERLAELSGVPLPTLGKIERLERSITLEQLGDIAYALDMSEDELLAEARRTREMQEQKTAGDVGPLVTSRGTAKGRATDEQTEEMVEWAQAHRKPVRGPRTANPDQESAATNDHP